MPTSSPTAPSSATRTLAWVVLALSVLEVAAPVVTFLGPGTSPAGGSGADLLITPAGWTFAIWGPIYALAIVQAVVVLRSQASTVPRSLQVSQATLYLAGIAWIAMAALDSSIATAVALGVMFLAAGTGVVLAARSPLAPGWFATLTRTAIGLYAGWVTAALFLNLSTALVEVGAVEAGDLDWQLLMLGLAVVALLVVLVAARGVVAFAVAGVWALVGIFATGVHDDSTALLTLTVVAAVVVVAATVVTRRAHAPR